MGTTMLGSTIGSLKNRTGTALITLVASGIQSSKVQPDALNLEWLSFVPGDRRFSARSGGHCNQQADGSQ
jgi:hypothetical protein